MKNDVSKTDLPQQCLKHPKQKRQIIQTAEILLSKRENDYQRSCRQATEEDLDILRDRLNDAPLQTPMKWLLENEHNAAPSVPCPIVDDLTETFLRDKQLFFSLLKMSEEDILAISQATVQQRATRLWHQLRRGRLTASNFGKILSHITESRTEFPKSFIKSITNVYNLENSKAISWGLVHEDEAIKQYKRESGRDVYAVGLWLSECGMLGCSPDGLIGSDGVIEVKCPFSLKDMTVEEGCAKSDFCIDPVTMILRYHHLHVYYNQVQACLHLTGRKWCDFIIWTPKDFFYTHVDKDESWASNLVVLCKFYMNVFVNLYFGHVL